jgi:hypothetical protein
VLGRAEVEHRSLADVEVHLLVHLLPVGEHVVVALANRKETLQGTLENVVFHEDDEPRPATLAVHPSRLQGG